ncbi:MAG TPA: hypothetical protein VGS27_05915 [Candidatus Sulfotelmatobacter sp.]|nr:hypothetical protein [Candidatus Sulfotelmatobacter sp.]
MRRPGWIKRALPLTVLSCVLLSAGLAAQVTVSGTGTGSGVNGLTITEASSIPAVSGSETLWADSTDGWTFKGN